MPNFTTATAAKTEATAGAAQIIRTAQGSVPKKLTLAANVVSLLQAADFAAVRTALSLGTAALVADSGLVHIVGTETVTGAKTFSTNPIVANTAPGLTFKDTDSAAGANTGILKWLDSADGLAAQIQFVGDSIYCDIPYATPGSFIWRGSAGFTTYAVINATAIRPGADNVSSGGAAGQRYTAVFAATGTINTSDAREKTALRPLSDAEKRAVRKVISLVGVFRWIEAVERKGDKARKHIGVTVQAAIACFEEEGLDPWGYGCFCADAIFEEIEVAPVRIIPAVPGRPATKEEPAVEAQPQQIIPPVVETRPKMGPDGRQLVRLGLRPDQLFWLALAAL